MRIRIGLTARSVPWEEQLRQEGVDTLLLDAAEGDIGGKCSALVVCAPLREGAVHAVREYLARGGAVCGYAPHLEAVSGLACRSEKIMFLLGSGRRPFPSVGLLDLDIRGEIPREANTLPTQSGSSGVFAGDWCGGVAVALPFDLREVLTDTRTALRAFPFAADRLPAERVSRVGRGEVAHLVHDVLEYLHHARGIPYAHMWCYPGGTRNVFALRIDTDAGTRRQVDALYDISRRHGTGFTWFLHTAGHAGWLDRFAAMEGQELGVHCHEHRVYGDAAGNRGNIERAKAALQDAGIAPAGYAAPYGFWNPDLGLVVEGSGFCYSSEFSFAYDARPAYPVVGYRRLTTVQVPVHPVCAGALRRAGHAESRMVRYFERVKTGKVLRREPLFFYHHPGDEAWEVVDLLCGMARGQDVRAMTLGAYARWWGVRSAGAPRALLDGTTLRLEEIVVPPDVEPVFMRVSMPGRREILVPGGTTVDLNTVPWETVPEWIPPVDLRDARGFDLRTVLGGVFATLERRMRGVALP